MSSPSAAEPGKPERVAWRRLRLLTVYGTVARVLASYGVIQLAGLVLGPRWREQALRAAHPRNARRVERRILLTGGLFVKLGQLLSILTNFLPEDFRSGLQGVQDRVPERPYEQVAATLERELGAPIGERFAHLEQRALASASLAQVHAATLPGGRRVAVKVQHADIETVARLDLATMRRVVWLVEVMLRLRGLRAAYGEVRAMILEELDFAREADHVEAIGATFAGDRSVVIPEVVRTHSTARVLTTTFVEGIKISDLDALTAAGFDRARVAEQVLGAYCRMVFDADLYHADPHPGNLFVTPEGAIAFVDFGAVSRLAPRHRSAIPQLVEGVLRRDPERIQVALRSLGFIARGGDRETAEKVIAYLQERFLDAISVEGWSLQDIHVDARMKVETIADLRRLGISLGDLQTLFEIPREWVLLQRTLMLLLGLCTHLDPGMQPLRVVRPYLEQLVLGGDRDWTGMAAAAVKGLLLSVLAFPDEVRRALAKANRGELALRVKGLEPGLDRLYALGHQLLYGLFTLAAGGVAYHAHLGGDGEVVRWAGAGGAFFALCLLGSMLRARRPR